MGTSEWSGFADAPEVLGLRVEAAELPGLLSKQLVVPQGAVALVRYDDGQERLLGEGERASGPRDGFRALLIKQLDVAIAFEVSGLRTRDGDEATAGVEVVVRLPRRAIDVEQFERTLLVARARAAVALDDLRAYLRPGVQAGLGRYVRGCGTEELMESEARAVLEPLVREELGALAFGAGLEVLEVRYPSFACAAYEELRRQRAEARAREEALAQHERIQELRVRIERSDQLQRAEVEELARALRFQGVLKDLSLKSELERRRTEEELRRFEAIRRQLGMDETKALIFLLEDERLRAELIRELIRRDMTPEQLAAAQVDELERRLQERLEKFARHMAQCEGERQRRLAEGGMRTRRVLLALGQQALAYDPANPSRREGPRECYDFTGGPLGFVRSVRAAVTREGPCVLAGAQRGVYLVQEGLPATARALRFPREPRGQGGVNAAAYFDGYIYATHSELGLYRWDQYQVRGPEQLFEEVTRGQEVTRGVTIDGQGRMYFSSGPDVYRAELLHPERALVRYRGGHGAVTAFATTRHEIFAGTSEGRVLRWSVDDPGSPREVGVRKANPIYMLRVAEIGGMPHLLIGAKEHGITAVSLEEGGSFDYRGPDQIRWVDGASDLVFGVTRGGFALHVWEAERREEVAFTIRTAERVQDLWVIREPMHAAV
ncbi:MAG: hypothetical protein KatS3mg102_0229 [Planctomycetota bacterium]|nr:MAG: hypothetical protein KatS3mg102_0229 [Planctomycetota bacterium]